MITATYCSPLYFERTATYRYLPLLTATYRYPELTAQRIAHLRRRASCAYTCYDYSVLTTTAYLPTIASSTRCFIEARVLASALQSRTFRCSSEGIGVG